MQRFLVAVVLAVCLGLIDCGPVSKVNVNLSVGVKKLDCMPEYHNFTCRSWDVTPVKEPAFVEPVFKEIDCISEPYHLVRRQPSTEQPIPN